MSNRILELIAKGLHVAEIAEQLGVSREEVLLELEVALHLQTELEEVQ